MRRLGLLVLSAWIGVAAPALAEKRVALVIGNAAYKHAPALANPRNDAEGMAAALKRLKFEVIAGLDLDEAASRRLLREFAEKLEGLGKDDVAVFFYAGHGLQVGGRNYLVPVDAKLEKERDLDFQAVAFDFVQSLMEKTAQTNIVILDSCRDNPLARTLARGMGTRSTGIGRGLAEVRGINDTLIVYATSPGNVALDGAARNSPFTAALLKHIEAPGLEVRHMVSQVRAAVIAATKGQQVPWEAASLTRQVYFAPAAASPASPGATPPAAPTPAPPGADGEIVFWQSIQNSKSAADYKAYLEKYPNGMFASLAKLRIAEIEKAAVVAPPPISSKPAPAPPRRASTFEVGMFLSGPRQDFRVMIATAEACRNLCLADTQCVAWRYSTDGYQNAPRTCALLPSVESRHANQHFVSGVIRTAPAAAPAQPPAPAPKAQPAAPVMPGTAPQTGDALVQELVRKAQAREKEDGFCARTKWGYIDNVAASGRLPPGALIVHSANDSCGVVQVGQAYARKRDGRPCKRVKYWYCDGGGCRITNWAAVCHEVDGAWTARISAE